MSKLSFWAFVVIAISIEISNGESPTPIFVDVPTKRIADLERANIVDFATLKHLAKRGYRVVEFNPTQVLNQEEFNIVLSEDVSVTLRRSSLVRKPGRIQWQGQVVLKQDGRLRSEGGRIHTDAEQELLASDFLSVSMTVYYWDREKVSGSLKSAMLRPELVGQGIPAQDTPVVKYLAEHDMDAATSVITKILDPISLRTFYIKSLPVEGDLLHVITERDPVRASFIQVDGLFGEDSLTLGQQKEKAKYEAVIRAAEERATKARELLEERSTNNE